MAAINDWVVNVVNAVVTAFAVNFGVPLLIGMTGSRGIVQWGSGVTGAVAISTDRQGHSLSRSSAPVLCMITNSTPPTM